MKQCIALTLSILLIMTSGACCSHSESLSVTGIPPLAESASAFPQVESAQSQSPADLLSESEPSVTITIGDSVFSTKLYDNETVTELLALLPMTLNMFELNGNEKYYNLPDRLPADSQRVGRISAGDLMLYGSDYLVLFYESFTTSYNYTKLGYIEDASGLAGALGCGSVEVTFAVNN